METSAISKAVEAVGGQSALARKIGVPPALVWQWVNGRRPVAPHHAIPIEQASGVTRYELLPDVFGANPAAANTSSYRERTSVHRSTAASAGATAEATPTVLKDKVA